MKLFKYLKPYWIFAVLTPLLMIMEVFVDLQQPALMSKIVDDGVLGGNLNVIVKTGFTMLGLLVLGVAGGVGSSATAGIASQSFSNDLRKDVYDKVMSLSFEQTDKFTTGSLITRLTNDVTQVQELVSMVLRMFVRSGLMFAGGIIMTMSLSLEFTKVLLIALPVQLVVIIVFLSKATPLFGIVQKRLDKVNSVVQENVSGSRVVKAYVREEYEKNRFSDANNNLMNINLKVQKILATAMPVLMLIMNISVVAIIYIGGKQVEAQNMQVGAIMASVTYATMIIMSLMMISNLFQGVSRARASAKRIIEVLSTEPAIQSGENTKTVQNGNIKFSNVNFHYPNFAGKPVLQNLNFEINAGETVAILGSTGSGKSSLVNLIPRFYDVTDGQITIDGIDVRDYDLNALRDSMGVVLQKNELFAGSITENIRWGDGGAPFEKVRQAALIAQADDFISSFNNGYDTIIGEKGSSLSGGQKQRICIARAIIRKPKILIFDDSTSALDLGTEARLQKALRENLAGTTVIMIAQRVASVKNADKIIVLDKGTVSAIGTHDELLKTSDVYKDIYNSQMKKGDADNEQ